MNGLRGKRVMITGAAQGIGLATAERFAREGADLMLVDLEVPQTLTVEGHWIRADLATSEGLSACRDAMEQKGIDVLINNAGITRDAQLLKMTRTEWDSVMAVNLTAVFELSQMAAKHMVAQQFGVILSASSVVAHYGNFGQVNYAATKAGIIAMTQTMAKELGRHGVRVNAVAPGFIETRMVQAIPAKVLDSIRQKPALKCLGLPKDIASAYAFLASDDARYITGATLNVDGGMVLG
ncbi:MAG: SDR family oxidoreductase [Acidobacteria bacterium]|nr:SDR family oxidoreductase [Acidobacteriota bacterium]